jgi:hypothetical protein
LFQTLLRSSSFVEISSLRTQQPQRNAGRSSYYALDLEAVISRKPDELRVAYVMAWIWSDILKTAADLDAKVIITSTCNLIRQTRSVNLAAIFSSITDGRDHQFRRLRSDLNICNSKEEEIG